MAISRTLAGCGSLALLLCLTACAGSVKPDSTGTVYLNAKIYTQNSGQPVADALVVQDGKFVLVGNQESVQSYLNQGFDVVDLGGRMVMPGLHDNHVHGMDTVALDMCDLDGKAMDLETIASTVQQCIKHYDIADGDWLVVNQWVPYEGNQPSEQYPTLKAALDSAAPGHPVILKGVDAHTAAYNSAALALATTEEQQVLGYNKETLAADGAFAEFAPYVNLTSGVIRENARDNIPVPQTDLFTADDDVAALYEAKLPQISRLFAKDGITGIQDPCVNDFIRSMYHKMEDQGILHMRVTTATCFIGDDYAGVVDIPGHLETAMAAREANANDPLINANAVKIFIDGVLEGDPFSEPAFPPNAGMLHSFFAPHLFFNPKTQSAEFTADSEQTDNNGIVNYGEEDLKDYVTALDANGFIVHMHSIGDRSTRVSLDALEAARERNGESGLPHTIAHLQMVHPGDQKRLGELNVYLAFTYAWIGTLPEYDILVTPFLEPSRKGQDVNDFLYNEDSYTWSAIYPVESSRKAGAVLVAGSDAPVDSRDPRPFVNIAAGITRAAYGGQPLNFRQSTSLENMLAAYTINGARAVQQDDITGSIEVGKSADFIVLDRNLFALVADGHPEEIADTQVDITVFRGEEVYRR